jgi:hypothetical protein
MAAFCCWPGNAGPMPAPCWSGRGYLRACAAPTSDGPAGRSRWGSPGWSRRAVQSRAPTGTRSSSPRPGRRRRSAGSATSSSRRSMSGTGTSPAPMTRSMRGSLLQHLSQADRLLRRMWAAPPRAGVLIAGGRRLRPVVLRPAGRGFELFLDACRRVLTRRGGDHAIGRNLYRYSWRRGSRTPQVTLVQSAHGSKPRRWRGPRWRRPRMPSSRTAWRTPATSLPRWPDCAGPPTIRARSPAAHASSSPGPGGSEPRSWAAPAIRWPM